jgi:phosphoribosyl 1,2-cyclic phosphodiesterase
MTGNSKNTESKNTEVVQNVINFNFDDTPILDTSERVSEEAESYEATPLPRLRYISFGSGSSGNSCYLGSDRGGVLIDAGVDPKKVETSLRANGIVPEMVKGVLLTHDHTDHIKYVYKILRSNRNLRLFCTNRVLNGILRRHNISKRIKEYHTAIFKEIPFKILDFDITAFEVPHDGTDNMGFNISFHSANFVLATDLGAVTERARYYMERATHLVIEANYDLRMLLDGKYPEYLKARIQTENGHMDNVQTARFLQEIINPNLKYIFLCHLSKDNNTPEIALHTVEEALKAAGVTVGAESDTLFDRKADVRLMALPRYDSTRLFVFRV